jgi:hypothetical protein
MKKSFSVSPKIFLKTLVHFPKAERNQSVKGASSKQKDHPGDNLPLTHTKLAASRGR